MVRMLIDRCSTWIPIAHNDVDCEFVTKRYFYDIFPEKPDGICLGLVGVFFNVGSFVCRSVFFSFVPHKKHSL